MNLETYKAKVRESGSGTIETTIPIKIAQYIDIQVGDTIEIAIIKVERGQRK